MNYIFLNKKEFKQNLTNFFFQFFYNIFYPHFMNVFYFIFIKTKIYLLNKWTKNKFKQNKNHYHWLRDGNVGVTIAFFFENFLLLDFLHCKILNLIVLFSYDIDVYPGIVLKINLQTLPTTNLKLILIYNNNVTHKNTHRSIA